MIIAKKARDHDIRWRPRLGAALVLALVAGACGDDEAGLDDAAATEGSGSATTASGTDGADETSESGSEGSSTAGDTVEPPPEFEPIEATLADVRAQVAEGSDTRRCRRPRGCRR